MAQISVRGRLVDDPVRRKPTDSELVSFRFRSDEHRKGNGSGDSEYIDMGNFFDVTVWREDLLDGVCLLKKGDRVIVDGRMMSHHWTDDKGTDRYELQITAREISPYLKDLKDVNYKPRGQSSENQKDEHEAVA